MLRARLSFFVLALISWSTNAERIKQEMTRTLVVGGGGHLVAPAAQASVETFEAVRGAKLGKYTLIERLRTISRYDGESKLENAKWPKELMPMEFRFEEDPKRLGKGAFGEVWEAHDKVTGESVAIKVFYKSTRTYLTWSNATFEQKHALESASVECELQQKFIKDKDVDPVGARRVTACIEDHVRPNKGTDRICYLVLEIGGGDDLEKLLDKWNPSWPPQDFQEHMRQAREIIVGILQGLRFLQSLDPPIIHHDLKPENVAWTLSDGHYNVKLIDFGAALEGTMENLNTDIIYTLAYTPLEVVNHGITMAEPWHSYDMYAVGLIYWQLLCPLMRFNNLFYFGGILNKKPEFQKLENMKSLIVNLNGDRCPIAEEEVALIVSMLGPAGDRPSPAEALASPFLASHVQESVVANKDASEEDALARLHDISSMFISGRLKEGFTKLPGPVKCCCPAKNSQCKLVDLSVEPPACSGYFQRENSCSCRVGKGWKSFWRLKSSQCLISGKDIEELQKDPKIRNTVTTVNGVNFRYVDP